MKAIVVQKRNGEFEEYNENKLRHSLQRSGTEDEVVEILLKKVRTILHNGISTKEIFDFVFKELKKDKEPSQFKYNLKNALITLKINGGYTFEKFVGKLLGVQGYEVKLNQIVKGELITHEIDVTAKKGKEILMIEAKHHDKPWLGESIQTALYVYARFLDLKKSYTKSMLVTNTKFSPQVIEYSNGVGIQLLGWNFPKTNSLKELVEKFKLYPITVLNIKKEKILSYLENGIITIQDLQNVENLSPAIKKEIEEILKSN